MAPSSPPGPLRIGLLGSGFVAHFHLQAFLGVRDLQVAGVFSPTRAHREALAAKADALELGPCQPFASLEAMVGSPAIDAIWILAPNYTRLEHMQAIHRAATTGRTALRAVACEKPLARTLGEAREMKRLADEAGLLTGYLENQIFSTAVQRGKEIVWRRGAANAGRPYLARAAEEHSGPHRPWFWRGDQQGGGVLSDMMCHSLEVARFLLTDPTKTRSSLRPLSASGTVATLKWTQPEYARRLRETMGPEVDYQRAPAEDFARGTVVFEDDRGQKLIIEATTSWAYVGPGLRLQMELLGPEYAMEFSSLATGLRIFMSRAVTGSAGEDLVEKQNAEQGLMPVVEDEAGLYGYTLENRHMVERFRRGERPLETFDDGVAVAELLMAVYKSAETGRTVALPDPELTSYVPPVARGGSRGS